MDAFSYLSVLLSIILGLAITQVLQGYRLLMLGRERVTLYAPPLILSAIMLLFATQSWWSSFGLASHSEWEFASFFVILFQTILIYMMAAIVLPDVPTDQQTDLRVHYYREHRAFFGLFVTVLFVSVLKEYALDGRLPLPENLAFHTGFGVVALAGMMIRRPRVHEFLAPALGLLAVLYIALLFARL